MRVQFSRKKEAGSELNSLLHGGTRLLCRGQSQRAPRFWAGQTDFVVFPYFFACLAFKDCVLCGHLKTVFYVPKGTRVSYVGRTG